MDTNLTESHFRIRGGVVRDIFIPNFQPVPGRIERPSPIPGSHPCFDPVDSLTQWDATILIRHALSPGQARSTTEGGIHACHHPSTPHLCVEPSSVLAVDANLLASQSIGAHALSLLY